MKQRLTDNPPRKAGRYWWVNPASHSKTFDDMSIETVEVITNDDGKLIVAVYSGEDSNKLLNDKVVSVELYMEVKHINTLWSQRITKPQ